VGQKYILQRVGEITDVGNSMAL